jgi:hypothetical protein
MALSDLEMTAAKALLENGFNLCHQGHLDWVSSGGANCGCHPTAAYRAGVSLHGMRR